MGIASKVDKQVALGYLVECSDKIFRLKPYEQVTDYEKYTPPWAVVWWSNFHHTLMIQPEKSSALLVPSKCNAWDRVQVVFCQVYDALVLEDTTCVVEFSALTLVDKIYRFRVTLEMLQGLTTLLTDGSITEDKIGLEHYPTASGIPLPKKNIPHIYTAHESVFGVDPASGLDHTVVSIKKLSGEVLLASNKFKGFEEVIKGEIGNKLAEQLDHDMIHGFPSAKGIFPTGSILSTPPELHFKSILNAFNPDWKILDKILAGQKDAGVSITKNVMDMMWHIRNDNRYPIAIHTGYALTVIHTGEIGKYSYMDDDIGGMLRKSLAYWAVKVNAQAGMSLPIMLVGGKGDGNILNNHPHNGNQPIEYYNPLPLTPPVGLMNTKPVNTKFKATTTTYDFETIDFINGEYYRIYYAR